MSWIIHWIVVCQDGSWASYYSGSLSLGPLDWVLLWNPWPWSNVDSIHKQTHWSSNRMIKSWQLNRDICLNRIIDHCNTCHRRLVDTPTFITPVLGGNDVLLDTPLCLWVIIWLWLTASTVVTYRVTHKSPFESCISTRLITTWIEQIKMRDCKLNSLIYWFILSTKCWISKVCLTHVSKVACQNRTPNRTRFLLRLGDVSTGPQTGPRLRLRLKGF